MIETYAPSFPANADVLLASLREPSLTLIVWFAEDMMDWRCLECNVVRGWKDMIGERSPLIVSAGETVEELHISWHERCFQSSFFLSQLHLEDTFSLAGVVV